MRRGIFVLLAVALLISPAFAADKKPAAKVEPPAALQAPVQSEQDAARQELVANISGMRNQELRVAILQQLLGEESAKLMNIQAVFCDRYKLDVEKWRKGLYRYDEKQGKFVEQPVQPAAQQ